MVVPGILQSASVRNWLGGIEPAWTLLDPASFSALQKPPSSPAGAIRLATDLSPDEIGKSAVARNTLILLHATAVGSGLELTATGNLTRKVVAEMLDVFSWPGFDKTEAFRLHKVINEPDFLPLFFTRHLVEAGRFVKRRKDRLKIAAPGLQVIEDPGRQGLPALLFHLALWAIDLGYFGRAIDHGWPQRDAGIVLWSLSIAANDWQPPERLTRMCTIPTGDMLNTKWDTATYAMEARILRPLWWFGLLDRRQEDIPGQSFAKKHFYRKAPLFDRLISFDVKLEAAAGPRH